MATDRQIAANRANAAKSTGPKTTTGRKTASRNSLRHGMLAHTIVLEGESLERFALLLSALQDEFQPQTSVEFALIENMAAARWRQMRLWAMEKAEIALEIRKQEPAEDSNHDPATRAALAFRTLTGQSRALELMNRYETRFDRQYTRSLDRLLAIHRRRTP